MGRRLWVAIIWCALLASACRCEPGAANAGASDGGEVDAGTMPDGTTDAGVSDAGVSDAGVSDAGVSDAGDGDAGDADGGSADAGVTDAGVTDAGAVDAGPADAGAVSDGGGSLGSDGGKIFDAMSAIPNLPLPMTLAADFDNDGHRDGFMLQSTGVGTGATAVVALATGPGTYTVTFDAGFSSSDVRVFDIDFDGILDLQVKEQGPPKWTAYHRGDGLGHFTFQGRWANASSLFDVDGDGVPESVQIVAESYSAGKMYVSKTFTDGGVDLGYASHSLSTSWDLIADFNDDRIPDYVSVGDYLATSRQLQVFFGQADGGIVGAPSMATCSTCDRGQVVLGDMNADGRRDVVVLTTSAVMVWTVGANGSLTSAQTTSRKGGRILAAYVADMDVDGRADIVAQEEGGSNDDGVRIYFSRVAGLEASDDYILTEQGLVRGVTDVNYDGRPDVLLMDNHYAEGRDGLEVLRLPARSLSQVPTEEWGWFDMNGDGLKDGVSWLPFQDKMATAPMGPRRRFEALSECPVASRRVNESRKFRDLDGDGLPDQYSFNSMGLEVSKGRGSCAFEARSIWLPAPAYGTWLDVNGDRRLDMAGAQGTLQLQLDAGAFGPTVVSGLPNGATFFSTDWSGDGYADVIVLDTGSAHITFAQGDGTGRFNLGAPQALPPGGMMDSATLDVDGDGDLDVLISASDVNQSSRVDLWRQVSPGSFSLHRAFLDQACSYWTTLFAADLDLDGTPELVASCQVMTKIWSLGVVPRWRQTLMFYSTGAVFDADGDGDLDLVNSQGVAMNLTRSPL
jgi:hypothetical protein